MAEKIGTIIGNVLGILIVGGVMYYAYNEIALAFNLPNFNYWTIVATYFSIKKLQK